MKARAADVAALEARVRALHSLRRPRGPGAAGAGRVGGYLAWLADATARPR